jgi:hypothetical protein
LQQVADNDGQAAEGGGILGACNLRVAELTAFAGKTVNGFALMSGWNSLGRWDVWYADIALDGADGTVTQLFNNQPIPTGSLYVSDTRGCYAFGTDLDSLLTVRSCSAWSDERG